MTASPLAPLLGDFADTVRRSGVPKDVARSVRQRILDIVGICLAAVDLDTSAMVRDYVATQGGGPSSVIGGGTSTAAWAALANGVLAHSLDYDDTHLPSVLHPSAAVVPAALAAAERERATGYETVCAIAAGIETCVRLGMAGYDEAAGNSTYFEHGQHATSICGTLGAAVASAMLMGLESSRISDAIGIASSMAAGVIEANRMGGTVKRMHCGWAAHSGLVAADLAAAGVTGPPTVLEGRFGLFEAFLHGRFNETPVRKGLGTEWSVPGIFFKPYPANHFTHAVADAVMTLRKQGLRADGVERMVLGVASPTVRTIGQPIERKRRPQTGYQGQFSGPYVAAAALLGGSSLGLGLDDFTDGRVAEPEARALMDKIEVVANAECDAIYPYQFPAVVDVWTKDGTQLTEKVLANRGGPQRPLSDAELMVKFRDNAGRWLSESEVAELGSLILGLEAGGDVAAVMSLMVAGRG
jgi:2-methylcitrate dehydratase PrpD